MANVSDQTNPSDWNKSFFEGVKALQTGAGMMIEAKRNEMEYMLSRERLSLEKDLANLKLKQEGVDLDLRKYQAQTDRIKVLTPLGALVGVGTDLMDEEASGVSWDLTRPEERRKLEAEKELTQEKYEKMGALEEKKIESREKLSGQKETGATVRTALKEGSYPSEGATAKQVADTALGNAQTGVPTGIGTELIKIPKHLFGKEVKTVGDIINVLGGTDFLTRKMKIGGEETTGLGLLKKVDELIEADPNKSDYHLKQLVTLFPELEPVFGKNIKKRK